MAETLQRDGRAARDPGHGVTLFCFPHAGGNSSMFRDWGRHLPADVKLHAVELPGRQSRFREPPVDRLPRLTSLLVRELRPRMASSVALFGHSLGALIAFELAREMRREGLPPPAHLFVSSQPAPHLPRRHPAVHHLPEPLFMQSVSHMLPPEVLANRGLLNVILPTLRADFALAETYQYAHEPPLDCPVTALGGSWDPGVLRADLKMWQPQTSGDFSLRLFPGDHYYLRDVPERVLETIREGLGGQAGLRQWGAL